MAVRTPSARVIRGIDERALRLPEPFQWILGRGLIHVKARSPRIVILLGLWVDPRHRRQGAGRYIVRELCELADCHGVTVATWADPYGHGPLNKLMSLRHLERWYARSGFVPTTLYGRKMLVRSPTPQ